MGAVLLACDPSGREGDATDGSAEAPRVDPAALERASAELDGELAIVEARLDSLPGLILSVRRTLRRYLNDEHVARARALGVGAVGDTADIHALVDAGELVRLPDSTRHWIVRELDQSLPYATPEKKAALEELGDRFHRRLADAGLPPFRMEISSALRTGALQRELRSRNRNASRTQSSHEFGTTVDIAYNEFSGPALSEWAPWRSAATGAPAQAAQLRRWLDREAEVRLDSLGNDYADHLKGELGAVLQEMQAEGRLWPLYERSQPVFHTTLASRRPAAPTPAR